MIISGSVLVYDWFLHRSLNKRGLLVLPKNKVQSFNGKLREVAVDKNEGENKAVSLLPYKTNSNGFIFF